MSRRRTKPQIVNRGTIDIEADVVLADGPIRTHVHVEPTGRLRIGRNSLVNFGCGIACESQIDIGRDVTLGPYVQILDTAFHQTSAPGDRPEASSVSIGDGAVVGAWSIVLPGAVIDPGSVVAPYSTVTARR